MKYLVITTKMYQKLLIEIRGMTMSQLCSYAEYNGYEFEEDEDLELIVPPREELEEWLVWNFFDRAEEVDILDFNPKALHH